MDKTKPGVQHGISSPMNGTMGMNVQMPKIADNTTCAGTAPNAAKMQSPTQPKNPVSRP